MQIMIDPFAKWLEETAKPGAEIRSARESRGWSQAKLAKLAGTTQQTLDRIERGETLHSRATGRIIQVLSSQTELERITAERDAARKALEQIRLMCRVGHDRLGNVQRVESIDRLAAVALGTSEVSPDPLKAALERIALLDEADGHELTARHAHEAVAIATNALVKHPSEICAESFSFAEENN